jgi:hypothetical protein
MRAIQPKKMGKWLSVFLLLERLFSLGEKNLGSHFGRLLEGKLK